MIKRKKKTTEEVVAQMAQDYIGGYVSSMNANIHQMDERIAVLELVGFEQVINRLNKRQEEMEQEFKAMIEQLKPEESVRYMIEELQARVDQLEGGLGY